MQKPQFPDPRSFDPFDPLPGESQEDRDRRVYSLDPTVQAAERVSAKFQELDCVLQEWDISAAEASKASQGLQEASKGLVDLEIVVSSGYRTEADQRAIDALPKGPSFHAQRPVLRGGLILHENQRPPKEPDIDQALRDLFREPWYKRLWSMFWGRRHETVEESFARLHTSRKALIDHFVDRIGGVPFRLWSWLRGTK